MRRNNWGARVYIGAAGFEELDRWGEGKGGGAPPQLSRLGFSFQAFFECLNLVRSRGGCGELGVLCKPFGASARGCSCMWAQPVREALKHASPDLHDEFLFYQVLRVSLPCGVRDCVTFEHDSFCKYGRR